MTRARRVTHLPTHELENELADLFIRWRFVQQDHAEGIEAELLRINARWTRVARELARRDYRFRDHGRECTCGDCIALLDTWRSLQRSENPSMEDYSPR